MVSEIEAKRKKLEDKYNEKLQEFLDCMKYFHNYDKSSDYYKILAEKDRLEFELKGFNLGVEMARKEVFDNLMNRFRREQGNSLTKPTYKFSLNEIRCILEEELKKSLEDKK